MNTIIRKQEKMGIAALLFLAYWFVKSFYTQESGGLQIGDYIFVLSFAVFFIQTALDKDKGVEFIIRQDRGLLLFVFCVASINALYFILYPNGGFFMPIAYFIFNFLIVVEFRHLAKQKDFIKAFSVVTFLLIVLQVGIYFTGKGRWYDDVVDGRYMGTFNDPNQLAFFVMSRFFILYIIYNHVKEKKLWNKLLTFVAFVLTLFLIIKSASTGMLLGLGTFAAVWFINYCLSKKIGLKVLILLLAVLAVAGFVIAGGDKLIFKNSFISDRLKDKLGKMSGDDWFSGFVKDRNLGAFFEKPYYLLFGAGEGGWFRFVDVAVKNELHSTILGLLFYYGIIPFIILVVWIAKNLKHAKKMDFCVYVAIFVEMLTLINHRQAALWMLFILPMVLEQSREN